MSTSHAGGAASRGHTHVWVPGDGRWQPVVCRATSSLTGRLNVRRGGDPAAELLNFQQFLSPSQVLGPRIIRFGAAWRF